MDLHKIDIDKHIRITKQNIKKLRINNGLRQIDIASLGKTTQQKISHFEDISEPSKVPDLLFLLSLAKKFNISLDYLVGFTENNSFDDIIQTNLLKDVEKKYEMNNSSANVCITAADIQNMTLKEIKALVIEISKAGIDLHKLGL